MILDESFCEEIKVLNEEINQTQGRIAVMDKGNTPVKPKIKIMWAMTFIVALVLVGIMLYAMDKPGLILIYVACGLTVLYVAYYVYEALPVRKANQNAKVLYNAVIKRLDTLTERKSAMLESYAREKGGISARRVDKPCQCALFREESNMILLSIQSEIETCEISLEEIKYIATTNQLVEKRIIFQGDSPTPYTRIILRDDSEIWFVEEAYSEIINLFPDKQLEQ